MDGISQQTRLYRAAFLESQDFAAGKQCASGNPARVTGIEKQSAQPVFLIELLIPIAANPLSRGRKLERGQQAARHARIGLELQGKCKMCASVPHTSYMWATACYTDFINLFKG